MDLRIFNIITSQLNGVLVRMIVQRLDDPNLHRIAVTNEAPGIVLIELQMSQTNASKNECLWMIMIGHL